MQRKYHVKNNNNISNEICWTHTLGCSSFPRDAHFRPPGTHAVVWFRLFWGENTGPPSLRAQCAPGGARSPNKQYRESVSDSERRAKARQRTQIPANAINRSLSRSREMLSHSLSLCRPDFVQSSASRTISVLARAGRFDGPAAGKWWLKKLQRSTRTGVWLSA